MKLLLDQGLPRSAASLLRQAGMDVVHVGEIGYSTASDTAILRKALDEERIVVTLDADFHALLALSTASFPSVIRLRIEGLRGENAASLIQKAIEHFAEELQQGAVVTVQTERMRVRRLPFLT